MAPEQRKKEKEKTYSKSIVKCAILFILFVVLAAATPSTKEAATIIVIPAIVNNETVQEETKELYNIAKDYLKDLASGDKKNADGK